MLLTGQILFCCFGFRLEPELKNDFSPWGQGIALIYRRSGTPGGRPLGVLKKLALAAVVTGRALFFFPGILTGGWSIGGLEQRIARKLSLRPEAEVKGTCWGSRCDKWKVEQVLEEVYLAPDVNAFMKCHVKRTDVQVASGATPLNTRKACREIQA